MLLPQVAGVLHPRTTMQSIPEQRRVDARRRAVASSKRTTGEFDNDAPPRVLAVMGALEWRRPLEYTTSWLRRLPLRLCSIENREDAADREHAAEQDDA